MKTVQNVQSANEEWKWPHAVICRSSREIARCCDMRFPWNGAMLRSADFPWNDALLWSADFREMTMLWSADFPWNDALLWSADFREMTMLWSADFPWNDALLWSADFREMTMLWSADFPWNEALLWSAEFREMALCCDLPIAVICRLPWNDAMLWSADFPWNGAMLWRVAPKYYLTSRAKNILFGFRICSPSCAHGDSSRRYIAWLYQNVSKIYSRGCARANIIFGCVWNIFLKMCSWWIAPKQRPVLRALLRYVPPNRVDGRWCWTFSGRSGATDHRTSDRSVG